MYAGLPRFSLLVSPQNRGGVTQVQRVSDAQVLVHWANTWEPSSSLEDLNGVRTEAFDDYLRLHPEVIID